MSQTWKDKGELSEVLISQMFQEYLCVDGLTVRWMVFFMRISHAWISWICNAVLNMCEFILCLISRNTVFLESWMSKHYSFLLNFFRGDTLVPFILSWHFVLHHRISIRSITTINMTLQTNNSLYSMKDKLWSKAVKQRVRHNPITVIFSRRWDISNSSPDVPKSVTKYSLVWRSLQMFVWSTNFRRKSHGPVLVRESLWLPTWSRTIVIM